MQAEENPHDAVAYPGQPYADTHPDRLAVMAMLHGLEPTPVAHCRVLEVGCNEGVNLIPMAYAIPGSEFVGFDLAARPIARGQQRIRELGLTNLRLFQADLMNVSQAPGDQDRGGEPLGSFDYITAHGVYAWIPEAARDRLLALCRDHLTPNGIAFISYNALPGGHLRDLMRDILQFGSSEADSPTETVSHGLKLLHLITESRLPGDPLRAYFEKQAPKLEARDPRIVHHDELCGDQRAISFSDFIAHAGRHQLQYLSEAVLPPPTDACYKPQIVARAKALAHGDPIAEEQILDFARMRMFRETLLCHAAQNVSADLSIEAFTRLRLASPAHSSAGESASETARVYTLPGGIQMESRHAGTIALMEALIGMWPESVPFPQLAAYLEERGITIDAELLTLLLRLVVSRMVEFHAWAAPVGSQIPERPQASAVCRLDAAASDRTATLLHSSLHLADPLVRRFLLLLDGTRDRAALLNALEEEFPESTASALAEGIGPALRLLHQSGALLAEEIS